MSSSIAKGQLGDTNAVAVGNTQNDPEHTSEERNESQYPKGLKLVVIMVSLMLGTTLMSLDTTIISVATPKISTQFRALDDVGWYGAAYLMILTAATPIAANLYRYFNPKYIYLAFIAVFEGKSGPDLICSPFLVHISQSGTVVILTMTLLSWIRRLCFGTIFTRIHHRQSHRRFGCCWAPPRSVWHSDLRVST